jgi:hypothetical protein
MDIIVTLKISNELELLDSTVVLKIKKGTINREKTCFMLHGKREKENEANVVYAKEVF